MEQGFDSSAENFRRRSGILFIVLLLWAILAVVHIFYYSIVKREKLLEESRNLAWREGSLPSLRGRILSADSKVLAWTELTHDLILKKDSAKSKRFNNLITQLTTELPDLTPNEKENNILLKQNIPPEEILKLEKLLSRYSELVVVPKLTRRTIDDPGIRALLGETVSDENDPSLKGKSGLEKEYDTLLSGTSGIFRVMLDRRGNWVSGTIEVQKQPINGKDAVLPETLAQLRKRSGTTQ